MKQRLLSIIKIIVVIIMVVGYWLYVHYDEFNRNRKVAPTQKQLVLTSWWCLSSYAS